MRSLFMVLATVSVFAAFLTGCGVPDGPSVERVAEAVRARNDVPFLSISVTDVKITDLQCKRAEDTAWAKNLSMCSWEQEVHLDTRPDWNDRSKVVKEVKKARTQGAFQYIEKEKKWVALLG